MSVAVAHLLRPDHMPSKLSGEAPQSDATVFRNLVAAAFRGLCVPMSCIGKAGPTVTEGQDLPVTFMALRPDHIPRAARRKAHPHHDVVPLDCTSGGRSFSSDISRRRPAPTDAQPPCPELAERDPQQVAPAPCRPGARRASTGNTSPLRCHPEPSRASCEWG